MLYRRQGRGNKMMKIKKIKKKYFKSGSIGGDWFRYNLYLLQVWHRDANNLLSSPIPEINGYIDSC